MSRDEFSGSEGSDLVAGQVLQMKGDSSADIADWSDNCAKVCIRKFCMGVSSHLANIRRDTKKYLFSYLNVVLREGNWGELARIRQQLRVILQQETMGISIRSRFKENAETEKAILFHLNRENKNFNQNNHGKLKINKEVTENKTDIEN